ncbi:MAG: hypothetical protein GXP63_05110 [DPANN group archaeon]|nr:hypothetical protein [DPANN group archaeon]
MEFAADEWKEKKSWADEIGLALQKVQEKEKQEERRPITYYIPRPRVNGNHAQYTTRYVVSSRRTARDTTKHIPVKRFETHPMAFMGPGLLGFTYLWQDFMVVRDNLHESGNHNMVYVHESIHTEDEYETRMLTEWMLDQAPGQYETGPKEEEETDY